MKLKWFSEHEEIPDGAQFVAIKEEKKEIKYLFLIPDPRFKPAEGKD